MLKGEGKYEKSVGRLLVENPGNGAQGEGDSLSVPDNLRRWLFDRRDSLVGQTVKVRSQSISSRGVPRAGVFQGFRNGEIDLLMAGGWPTPSLISTPEGAPSLRLRSLQTQSLP